MEADKGNAVKQPDFNDLPNELLWRIFRHLGHVDLLQTSLVCRRWNQTIFHFLNDRFRFRPERCDGLHEHRTYKHLDLSVCPLPLPNQNEKWKDYFFGDKTQLERQNAAQVRSITVKSKASSQDLMMRLLITFKNLDTIEWDVTGKMMSIYKRTIGTNRMIYSNLAPVKHLKINDKVLYLKKLLECLSDSLVSLDVAVSSETFCEIICDSENSFPNLETLKVELERDNNLQLGGLLTALLETLPKLRKFSFNMNDPQAIEEVTEANTNIEEFELLGLVDYYVPDLSGMKNLKTFRTDATFLHFYIDDMTPPAPQVTTLDIDQAMYVDVDALVEHFPNLTALHMTTLSENSNRDLLKVATSYPNLERLSFRIQGPNFSTKLMLISTELTKLTELHVTLVCPNGSENIQTRAIAMGNFVIFESILICLADLRKLCICTDLIRNDTSPLVSINLPGKRPGCQVFVNGVLV